MEYFYSLIETYKYIILVPLVIIEGPIVAIIASLLASLGKLNIIIVFIVVALSDLLGDNIYYWIGRIGGERFIKRHGKRFNITPEKLAYAEEKCQSHLGKTLFLGKLVLAPIFVMLLAAGVTKMDYKKFFITATLATLPKTFLFVVIGFFFGKSYMVIDFYIKSAAISITLLILIVGVLYFAILKRNGGTTVK